MAIYHFHLKHGKAGNGKKHCDYINREGRYGSAKMKEELLYKEVGNLPSWAKSASEFFDYADVFERFNGNVYSEFEVALPAELSMEENIKLVKSLVLEHIGENKVYAFAIHEKMATLEVNQRQPHAHIMFNERVITDKSKVKDANLFFSRFNAKKPELGGYQKDNRFTQNRRISGENINAIREFWEQLVNNAYQQNGLEIRVSCKTLEQQRVDAIASDDELLANELNRPAQVHLGPKLAGQMKRALQRNDFTIEMLSPKGQVVYIAKQLKNIDKQIREHEQYVNELNINISSQNDNLSVVATAVEVTEVDVVGSVLSKKVLGMGKRLGHRLAENRAKISEFKKDILSDEGIYQISLSIFTKGGSKELNKQKRMITTQKEAYKNELANFSELKQPKFWEVSSRQEYQTKKLELEDWFNEIKEAEEKYLERKKYFDNEIAKEENQKRLAEVIEIFKRKRTNAEKFVEELTRENNTIDKLMNEIVRINSKIKKDKKYYVDGANMNSFGSKNLNALKIAIKTLRKNLSSSKINNKKSKNLIALSCRKDEEYDAENDIGI